MVARRTRTKASITLSGYIALKLGMLKHVIETAVGLAVCHFNNGMSAEERMMDFPLVLFLDRMMCSELDTEHVWQAQKKKKKTKRKQERKDLRTKKNDYSMNRFLLDLNLLFSFTQPACDKDLLTTVIDNNIT